MDSLGIALKDKNSRWRIKKSKKYSTRMPINQNIIRRTRNTIQRWGGPVGIILIILLIFLSISSSNFSLPRDYLPLILSFIPMVPYLAVLILRWHITLNRSDVSSSLKKSYDAVKEALSFGSVTPGRIGDINRVVQYSELEHKQVMNAFLVEKSLEIFGFVSLSSLFFYFSGISFHFDVFLPVLIIGGFASQLVALRFLMKSSWSKRTSLFIVSQFFNFFLILIGGFQLQLILVSFGYDFYSPLLLGCIISIAQVISALTLIPMGIGVRELSSSALLSLLLGIPLLGLIAPLIMQRIVFYSSILAISFISTSKKKSIDDYDRYNETYYERYRGLKNTRRIRYTEDLMKKYHEKDGIVLDTGCGIGIYSSYLLRNGWNIISLDLSLSGLRIAKRRMMALNAFQASVDNLPFNDQSFNFVLSVDVIEHLSSPLRYLKEVYRILRKNGLLIIQCPDSTSIAGRMILRSDKSHRRTFSLNEIQKICNALGYSELYSTTISFFPRLYPLNIILTKLFKSLVVYVGIKMEV